jgi:hypothetical protein
MALESQPPLMLWSWQKPDNLSILNPLLVKSTKLGVAFLTVRITVDDERITLYPRLSRLQLPQGIYKEAVVRIDARALPPLPARPALIDKLVERTLTSALGHTKVDAVQIDFDARVDQREFYKDFLARLRQRLPGSVALNMTALASWVQGDRWLEEKKKSNSAPSVPSVQAVVPMFFTMGSGKQEALEGLAKRLPEGFNGLNCIGLSLSDDAGAKVIGERIKQFDRIYLFCSPGWNRDHLEAAGRMVGQRLIAEEN